MPTFETFSFTFNVRILSDKLLAWFIFRSLDLTILWHLRLIYEHYKVLFKIRVVLMSIINISNARILEFTICLNKQQHLNESILCNLCLKENDLINKKLQSSILCVLVPQNGRYQLAINQRSPKSASKIFEWRKNVEC